MTRNRLIKTYFMYVQAKDDLKKQLVFELQYKSFRDLEKITTLNSKQIQRIINENKYPHFGAVVRALRGLLDNTLKPIKPKKRRE